ncbi:hypothetical protein DWB84_11625 [Saccharophagus sp. K07]|jgi:3-oxoacyl-[acyl-carrier-protein] synthase-1|uniref:hypothetical protein n=1 Tax=Saccharophagus sp. K07 TaxID=2283636 RepID=UPI001652299F|nr:hypothetical protein [Saccharophagus sp. K07]MBC6906109.1 hypothetical protein [Saccharophagus sp. K07]
MASQMEVFNTGLVTSVGLDLAHSAASVRAGLNRFQALEDTSVFDDDWEAPITGAPVSLLTKGYTQQARWLRLAEKAIKDLLSPPGSKERLIAESSPLMVIWALPNTSLFRWPDEQVPELLNQFLLAPLSRRIGIPLVTPSNGWICEGCSGGPRALRAIARSINAEDLPYVLCIGVDSLLEPLCLQDLAEQDRLKTPEQPTGLIPGEAAAAVLLKASTNGSRLKIYGALHKSLTLDREPENWRSLSAYKIGRELGALILEALSALGERIFVGDIYLDLNGEEWRAVTWSAALVILKGSKKIDLDSCEYRIPATSIGDVGAASSLVAIGLTAESVRRRYACANFSLICSVSDQADIGVVLVGI